MLSFFQSGIAAAGGLAQNYRGSEGDQYTSSIAIGKNSMDLLIFYISKLNDVILGIKMLQVAIGTTVGLLTSGLVVYSFGPRKSSALFAF